ncbi:tetratricopeptide repeat protein [Leptolyngbya sp. NIES-2104]|uniref:tetratricopeptide repeat protein n=1 Tax=Leptolyngbya sp. NIES-2104 TaxID=1552121 RepID=UPI0006EC9334|nr:hypothetical protein [Leptolyngbya sp. NIES-2104]GAP98147.1 hypothetical protein NIES2104_47000 [Leptolyngbya sp. NIES-2104]
MHVCKQLIGSSIAIGIFGLIAVPVSAQLSDTQVDLIVEALRQASKPEEPNTGLYSDWQVKPSNIPRWSKACGGREITPAEFQANPDTARSIVTCIVRDVIKQDARAIGNNQTIAVQRVAAWWMTGDSNKFSAREIAPYVQKALSAYQTASTEKPAKKETFYERYMNAGYDAAQRKDQKTARLYFQRALDERPQDKFALQALRNLGTAQGGSNRTTPITEKPNR